jgi:hypothetical protein
MKVVPYLFVSLFLLQSLRQEQQQQECRSVMICKTITAIKGVDESVMVPINISEVDRIWLGGGGEGLLLYNVEKGLMISVRS